jgi:hypothetical protein
MLHVNEKVAKQKIIVEQAFKILNTTLKMYKFKKPLHTRKDQY